MQTVSQVVASGTSSPPARWMFTYTAEKGQQLNTITVPSPTGTGNATATINYDSTGKVTSLVDANGNQRIYTYNSNNTQIQVKDAANNLALSWTQKFDTLLYANSINGDILGGVANVARKVTSPLRIGSGVGDAYYVEDENAYGRAALVLQDVVRAAAIINILGGLAKGFVPQTCEVPVNTNPFKGPVDRNVTAVGPKGDAIRLNPGEQLTGSPNGKWVQVRDASGKPTGTRLDGPHRPSTHKDPRARRPHGHVPGVKNSDGTPWLPAN